MRLVWLLVLAASGCRGILGIEPPIEVDVVDAAVDGPEPCATWHPQGFDPCTLGAAMPALHLGAGQYVYDTTLDGGKLTDGAGQLVARSGLTVMQSDGSAVAVLSVDALAIDPGVALRVVGPRPLLVVAWSTAVIDGVIDAGSHIGMPALGANANVACGAVTAGVDGTNASVSGGSGGGGGGSFQGQGGHGGSGGAAPAATGGRGGAAETVANARAAIHGGCPGGASGTAGAVLPAAPSTQALGGAGGGAIWLVAHDSIAIAGTISANGAGGAGAQIGSVCGGGGGGAGGHVALEAPSVTISGTVTANGGGGGGGGAVTDAGHDGADGKADVQAAPGGALAANGCGRPGGAGSAQAMLAGADALGTDTCGGGGGGGGAGFIIIASPGYTAMPTARISPPAIVP